MHEPSIISALKTGFNDPKTYYQILHKYANGGDTFFDVYLKAHIIVGYPACQEAYLTEVLGRSRLQLSPSFFEECENRRVVQGYEVLANMSVFLNAGDDDFSPRRQRLITKLSCGKKALDSGEITQLAAKHIDLITRQCEVDLFGLSLRQYAAECATLALFGTTHTPLEVRTDALITAYFFDGKLVSKPHVLNALEAIDRLATWIAKQHDINRTAESDLVADLVLLYVAAHESMAYLLYTCFKQLTREADLSRFSESSSRRFFVQEAMRLDSPVQMSGRVALVDTKIGNTKIKSGDKVYLHVGAANHDPRVFETPDLFMERRAMPHLAFGWGSTKCVGSEYATHCSMEYINQALLRFSCVNHSTEKTIFEHGLSARGLNAAYFTFS